MPNKRVIAHARDRKKMKGSEIRCLRRKCLGFLY